MEEYFDKYVKYIEKEYPVITKFEEIPGKIKYSDDILPRTGAHFGQRKLFLSEVQFLTKYYNQGKYVIYAGAAPSNKGFYLQKLFPKLKFILIDPNKFTIYLDDRKQIYRSPRPFRGIKYFKKSNDIKNISGYITNDNFKILIINDFFTDDLAKKLSVLENVLFISDIRTADEHYDFPSDHDILWNMSQMYNWIKLLKPEASCLKFRLPFSQEKIVKNKFSKKSFETSKNFGIDFIQNHKSKKFVFFKGKINLQTWQPRSSTETRLHVEGIPDLVEYDPTSYEDYFQFYNSVYRMNTIHNIPGNYKPEYGKYDYCNDCGIEFNIWKKYLIKILKKNVSGQKINEYRDTLTKYSNKFQHEFHGNIFDQYNIIENIKKKYFQAYTEMISKKLSTNFSDISKCIEEVAKKKNAEKSKVSEILFINYNKDD